MTDTPPDRPPSQLAMCGVKLRECHAAIRGAEERASAMAEAGTMAEAEYLSLCQTLKTTYSVVQTFQDLHAKCMDMHDAAGKLIETHRAQNRSIADAKEKYHWVIGSMLKKNRSVAGVVFGGIVKKQRVLRHRVSSEERVNINMRKKDMDACLTYLFTGDTDDETWRACVDTAERVSAREMQDGGDATQVHGLESAEGAEGAEGATDAPLFHRAREGEPSWAVVHRAEADALAARATEEELAEDEGDLLAVEERNARLQQEAAAEAAEAAEAGGV